MAFAGGTDKEAKTIAAVASNIWVAYEKHTGEGLASRRRRDEAAAAGVSSSSSTPGGGIITTGNSGSNTSSVTTSSSVFGLNTNVAGATSASDDGFLFLPFISKGTGGAGGDSMNSREDHSSSSRSRPSSAKGATRRIGNGSNNESSAGRDMGGVGLVGVGGEGDGIGGLRLGQGVAGGEEEREGGGGSGGVVGVGGGMGGEGGGGGVTTREIGVFGSMASKKNNVKSGNISPTSIVGPTGVPKDEEGLTNVMILCEVRRNYSRYPFPYNLYGFVLYLRSLEKFL